MKNIKQFVETVTHSRKRTGVIWLNRPELLQDLENCGVKLVDLSKLPFENLIITDDQMIRLITGIAPATSVAFLNLEIYLAPRFRDLRYLNYLLAKMTTQEPYQPIFLVFYSNLLFKKFREHYIAHKQTENHFYQES